METEWRFLAHLCGGSLWGLTGIVTLRLALPDPVARAVLAWLWSNGRRWAAGHKGWWFWPSCPKGPLLRLPLELEPLVEAQRCPWCSLVVGLTRGEVVARPLPVAKALELGFATPEISPPIRPPPDPRCLLTRGVVPPFWGPQRLERSVLLAALPGRRVPATPPPSRAGAPGLPACGGGIPKEGAAISWRNSRGAGLGSDLAWFHSWHGARRHSFGTVRGWSTSLAMA